MEQPRQSKPKPFKNKVAAVLAFTLLSGTVMLCGTPAINTVEAVAMPVSNLAVKQSMNKSVGKTIAREMTLQGISIGMTEAQLVKKLGQPARKDTSEYGFKWYIYNKDYKKYLQVGVSNGKVVGLYSNSTGWTSKKGIKVGTSRTQVEKLYGKPIKEIKKGNTIYRYNQVPNSAIYAVDNTYTTVFYDKHRKNIVTAVQVIDKQTELAFKSFHGKPSKELQQSFERQLVDLANAFRAQMGKKPFKSDASIANTARKHSQDMIKRDFFDHKNPDGKSPFDRMDDDNINYTAAAENIAAGQTSAIIAHEGWINSKGHRENILGDFARLGVGVAFGGDMEVFYTQNFYTP
ncbi:CAP domain-containing protein [Paenibacillus sp. SC116]|uniref:CAP domain-containing protein n=1 Tax=Paenibacillus sp. SC116 TaxID=2968986 RepID=UPI00215A104F|nr:CAP domain-containing protein [Paenibacillus sp. SC116]MCR8843352.1 CAP domain-containing protein [Paenibacillus sp. SC116]